MAIAALCSDCAPEGLIACAGSPLPAVLCNDGVPEDLAGAVVWALAEDFDEPPARPVPVFFWTADGPRRSNSPAGWGSLGAALCKGGPPPVLCRVCSGAAFAAGAGPVEGRSCCVVGAPGGRPEGAQPASEGTRGPALLSPELKDCRRLKVRLFDFGF